MTGNFWGQGRESGIPSVKSIFEREEFGVQCKEGVNGCGKVLMWLYSVRQLLL